MKYEDMPTGMLEGRILELLEDLAVFEETGSSDVPIIQEDIREARAELAKRKKSKTELLTALFVMS